MAAPGVLVLVVALCGAVAVLGLALGSESQAEVFLEPDLQARDQANESGASGNLIILTGLLVAAGVAVAAATLSQARPLKRLANASILFASAYLAVVLAQSAWPNYTAQLEERFADLSTSPAAANVPAAPSLFIAVFALATGAILIGGRALRRLLSGPASPPTPETLLVRQVAAVLLAAPFLVIAAWGNVRLLLALPANQPGVGPYLVVLPLIALVCVALLSIGLAKAWRLGTFVRNGRLAAAVQESWQGLGRAELAAAVALAALAALSSVLKAIDLGQLLYGGSFGATLRGHTQFLLLLIIPMWPALTHHRTVLRFLEAAPLHRATLEVGTDRLAVGAVACCAASLGLGGLATWLAPEALWAWLLALLPVTALAAASCGAVPSAPLTLLLAAVLWAIGNTVVAHYNGGQEAVLEFRDAPGLLALWRTLGALAEGFAVARLARAAAREPRAALAVPMSLGVGACVAGLALLEMPLSAWLLNRGQGEAIGVGSLVASQDLPVRVLLHALAAALGLAAAILMARLHRPDWFTPPPAPPLPSPLRAKARKAHAKPAPKPTTQPSA